jgi:hypothetical protein
MIEDDTDVERVEPIGWSLDETGTLFINMNIYPKGMTTGFKFYFKVTHKERGL